MIQDPRFSVALLAATPLPQTTIWQALHQDYSEDWIADESRPSEQRAGEICVKRLLTGDRGHFGPLEHPAVTFAVGYFPHSVMQQARTHRVGVSFDVQSGRYTSQRFLDCAAGTRTVEEVFYLRPVGEYHDRQGKRYTYTEGQRQMDLSRCYDAACYYAVRMREGMAEEHARGMIPFDFRQHFVVSFTLRALLHFLDMRAKADAQEEIRQLCSLMWEPTAAWVPEIAAWYQRTRWGKARLAP
jgi:thymidylate synthase (FAD)